MSEVSERIKELFLEIQKCLRLHRNLECEDPSSGKTAAINALENKQGELEEELLELTGLQIGDFDFHVE